MDSVETVVKCKELSEVPFDRLEGRTDAVIGDVTLDCEAGTQEDDFGHQHRGPRSQMERRHTEATESWPSHRLRQNAAGYGTDQNP